MKRVFLIMAGIALLSFSCKKQEPEIIMQPEPEKPDPPIVKNYMPLEIGNYWVYQTVRRDSSGNETITHQIDSNVIIGETIIREQLFYEIVRYPSTSSSFLRDSSGYLVRDDGYILFSYLDFTDPFLIDTLAPDYVVVEYTMFSEDTLIHIPFGSFNALTKRGKAIVLDPEYPYGINYIYQFYADDIGMIMDSYYYLSAPYNRYEKQLINFGNINTGKAEAISW